MTDKFVQLKDTDGNNLYPITGNNGSTQSQAEDEIFVADFYESDGISTPFTDVKAAYDAGKTIYCRYMTDGNFYIFPPNYVVIEDEEFVGIIFQAFINLQDVSEEAYELEWLNLFSVYVFVEGWGMSIGQANPYNKPADGIPKIDLDFDVQASLDKADTALQSVPNTYRTSADQDVIDGGKVDKVEGKGLSTEDYTTAEKTKLSGIEANADVTDADNVKSAGAVMKVYRQTNSSGSKSEIVKDSNGCVTIPAAGSLGRTGDGYVGILRPRSIYGAETDTTAALVGCVKTQEFYSSSDNRMLICKGTLENIKDDFIKRGLISNTAIVTDVDKEACCSTIGALCTSLKGTASGLAELDSNGFVPSSQLPSYVDDVLEYNSLSNFPATGESGKIYIAIDTNITYRWGGSTYVPIGSDLALGETSATAYRGDRGKIAYDHSQTSHAPANAEQNVQSDWEQSDNSADDYIKNKPTIPSAVTEETVSDWGFTKNTGTYSMPADGIPASDLAGGTMNGGLVANSTAVSTLSTAQMRNIYAGTSDIGVGAILNTGDIYLMYE